MDPNKKTLESLSNAFATWDDSYGEYTYAACFEDGMVVIKRCDGWKCWMSLEEYKEFSQGKFYADTA